MSISLSWMNADCFEQKKYETDSKISLVVFVFGNHFLNYHVDMFF